MFVRFRETKTRLQLSLVENRRANGKVHHEHIASLGSVETPPSIAARIEFWRRLHDRLGKLGNRVDPATQAKLLGDVHARVPMVTADEQRALQLENAEADERFWSSMQDMNAGTVEDHKRLVANAERAIVSGKSTAANAADKAAIAKERVERIKKGENVEGGLGKPVTLEDYHRILHEAGWTKRDIEHSIQVSQVSDVFGFEAMMEELHDARERSERNVVHKLHRRISKPAP
jgi:hypothetical protein